jgi:hypothetical protein
MTAYVRLLCLACGALCLPACAPMLSLVGTNQTVVQIVAQVERVKVAGDGASYVASSKTITDHALSMATEKDCKVLNIFSRDPVCKEKNAVTKVSVAPGPAASSIPHAETQSPHEGEMETSTPAPASYEGGEL